MRCDNGTKEIGHVGSAFLLSFSCNGLAAAPLIGEHVHLACVVPQPIPVETPVTTTSLLFAISVFFFQARRRPPSMIDSVPMM